MKNVLDEENNTIFLVNFFKRSGPADRKVVHQVKYFYGEKNNGIL